jgi:hypothetical protein
MQSITYNNFSVPRLRNGGPLSSTQALILHPSFVSSLHGAVAGCTITARARQAGFESLSYVLLHVHFTHLALKFWLCKEQNFHSNDEPTNCYRIRIEMFLTFLVG